MSEDWLEIKARGPVESKARAISILVEAGAPAVLESIERPCGLIESESRWGHVDETLPDIGPDKGVASFTAYLEGLNPERLKPLRNALRAVGWAFASSGYRESDWSSKWRSGIRPVRVSHAGKAIVIKPSWSDVQRRPGQVVIEIDPGMAFGTGSHSTTRMCLKAVLALMKGEAVLGPRSLLDVGTGTGVLAIAAKRLGIRRVVASDIDPVAIGVAKGNAKKNGVRIAFTDKPVEVMRGRFWVAVANILSREVIRLAPCLAEKLQPGGFLILSGILDGQKNGVVEAYTRLGLEFHKGYSMGEWRTVVLRKTAGKPLGKLPG